MDSYTGPIDISELWNTICDQEAARSFREWSGMESRTDDMAGGSDVGNSRSNNEDAHVAWRFRPPRGAQPVTVLIVADGVGGEESGEVASNMLVKSIAVDLFCRAFRRVAVATASDDIGFRAATMNTDDLVVDYAPAISARDLTESILTGHDRILREAGRRGMPDGIATTVVVAVLSGQTLHVAHAGDSRGYVFGKEGLRPVTLDHSVVMDLMRQKKITPEEARRHRLRHVITRTVGKSDGVEPESSTAKVSPSDVVMLCTDGLTDMLDDRAIEQVLRKTPLVSDQVRELIQETLQAGGRDNTTIALARAVCRPSVPPPPSDEAAFTICQFGRAITYRIKV
ncbi:MAG: hypothetical protein A3G34_04495 [Candidatus Lindowbacteria bacterium RIFCSPLOWO2_12_FULL_62_27]|nr:MAG: hypothetical protein A3I06_04255 [Candidatus Lindowbacteria bacterium RIFCSPLOWO2_02_FULL_62_12]OGH57422.1 MAG: hypothetical protein A3G34_04495 [Candidatus Lindowbacteria bacterium RIFCSPLOWO2_12_FULL_62_27]